MVSREFKQEVQNVVQMFWTETGEAPDADSILDYMSGDRSLDFTSNEIHYVFQVLT